MTELEIKAMVDRLVEEKLNQSKEEKSNKHMIGAYGAARNKMLPKLKECNEIYYAYKTADAIRDVCKNAIGLQYIQRATQQEIEKMAELYVLVAETVIEWAKNSEKNKK